MISYLILDNPIKFVPFLPYKYYYKPLKRMLHDFSSENTNPLTLLQYNDEILFKNSTTPFRRHSISPNTYLSRKKSGNFDH